MGGEAIKLEHITKVYKLYNRNRDRLKDSLGLTRKKVLYGALCAAGREHGSPGR